MIEKSGKKKERKKKKMDGLGRVRCKGRDKSRDKTDSLCTFTTDFAGLYVIQGIFLILVIIMCIQQIISFFSYCLLSSPRYRGGSQS